MNQRLDPTLTRASQPHEPSVTQLAASHASGDCAARWLEGRNRCPRQGRRNLDLVGLHDKDWESIRSESAAGDGRPPSVRTGSLPPASIRAVTLSAKSPAPGSKRGSRTKRGPLTLFEKDASVSRPHLFHSEEGDPERRFGWTGMPSPLEVECLGKGLVTGDFSRPLPGPCWLVAVPSVERVMDDYLPLRKEFDVGTTDAEVGDLFMLEPIVGRHHVEGLSHG